MNVRFEFPFSIYILSYSRPEWAVCHCKRMERCKMRKKDNSSKKRDDQALR